MKMYVGRTVPLQGCIKIRGRKSGVAKHMEIHVWKAPRQCGQDILPLFRGCPAHNAHLPQGTSGKAILESCLRETGIQPIFYQTDFGGSKNTVETHKLPLNERGGNNNSSGTLPLEKYTEQSFFQISVIKMHMADGWFAQKALCQQGNRQQAIAIDIDEFGRSQKRNIPQKNIQTIRRAV